MICCFVVEDKEAVMEGICVLDGQHRVLPVECGCIRRCQSCVAEGIVTPSFLSSYSVSEVTDTS